jgi:hypothetical protein
VSFPHHDLACPRTSFHLSSNSFLSIDVILIVFRIS